MRSALLTLIVAPLLVGSLPVEVSTPHEADPGELLGRYLVRFEDTVRNETDAVVRDVRCRALLPEDGPGQRVDWVRLSPHGWTLTRDAEGQWSGLAECAELAPGEAVTFGWLASVELRRRAPDDGHEPPGPKALGDGPMLGLDHPSIIAAAAEARAAATSDAPADLADSVRELVTGRVEYALDGGWLPAPEVLDSGRGSCSETTFVFVALCRRLGIPARAVGGSLMRAELPGRAVDASFHRVAEVWLPGRGWVPFETTSADGRLPERMLVLSRTAGTGSASGLYYHARNEWLAPSGASGRPRATKRAYWVDEAQALEPGGDPLAGLPEGHRASFARCELLLAESEGYGPTVAPGHLGAAPLRPGPPVRTKRECRDVLVRAAHPGALRVSHELSRVDAAWLVVERFAMDRVCEPQLEREFSPLLGRSAAEFEAWWAGASRRVTPFAPGRLSVTRTR